MKIKRVLTSEDGGPWEGISWEQRSSGVPSADGGWLFREECVIVPASWSQIATDIIARNYFRKAGVPSDKALDWTQYCPPSSAKGKTRDPGLSIPLDGAEHDARQVIHRLAITWMREGEKHGYFDSSADAKVFYDEICRMLVLQMAAPNSPQWFNTGLWEVYRIDGPAQGHFWAEHTSGAIHESTNALEHPQPHACFILSVKDDLVNEGGIMDLLTREARLFKYGSGTGSNLSSIRGVGEKLSGGGQSSGLLSFLKVADRSAGAIKSGGTTRRAAKMLTLDIDHPDVQDYIDWKVGEEHKVASLAAGSQTVVYHFEALRHAAKSYTGHEDDRFNPEKNFLLAKALRAALKERVPTSALYQYLRVLEQDIAAPAPESFSTAWDDEAYNTVSGQAGNNSLRLPNSFMRAVQDDDIHELKARRDGSVMKTLKARELWDQIARAAWQCADPGLQFHTTINEWHTCPAGGEIRASNPCSEYMFLDDTACNLASLNLLAFYDKEAKKLRLEEYTHAVRLWTIVLELSVAMAQFPSKRIAELSWTYRTLGLGFANLGSLLMTMGLPYDSEQGRAVAASLAAIMGGQAWSCSAELAGEQGPFAAYADNKDAILRVVENHRNAAFAEDSTQYKSLSIPPVPLDAKNCPEYLMQAARAAWNTALEQGRVHGFRNAQCTAIAPTGTIGLLMDCDTTGIEPDFALVKYKKLAGGGQFRMVNQSVKPALENLGYGSKKTQEILEWIEEHSSVEGCKAIKEKDMYVFDTASGAGGTRAIPWQAHISMMAAVQSFVCGAISKTVNMPNSATFNDIKGAYMLAWQSGVKAVALYRDGSKLSQPLGAFEPGTDPLADRILALQKAKEQEEAHAESSKKEHADCAEQKKARQLLPNRRQGYTQKAKIGGHSIFIRTGEYDDGKLGEIFLDMHKEGAAFRSLMNSFAIAVSLGLQYGVPLEEYVDAFTFSRFEPNGIVQGHECVKMATSVIDYVFRDLAISYLGRSDLGQVKKDDLLATGTSEQLEKEGKKAGKHAVAAMLRGIESATLPTEGKKHDTKHHHSEQAGTTAQDKDLEARHLAKTRGYEGDPCPVCGFFTLVRNGTCLKCDTCGGTTGCS